MTSNVPELEFSIDVGTGRLLWREQLCALPRAAWYQLRRLFRCEPRQYLAINGRVAARFTASADHLEFFRWIEETHTKSSAYSYGLGREAALADHAIDLTYADPGDISPA